MLSSSVNRFASVAVPITPSVSRTSPRPEMVVEAESAVLTLTVPATVKVFAARVMRSVSAAQPMVLPVSTITERPDRPSVPVTAPATSSLLFSSVNRFASPAVPIVPSVSITSPRPEIVVEAETAVLTLTVPATVKVLAARVRRSVSP